MKKIIILLTLIEIVLLTACSESNIESAYKEPPQNIYEDKSVEIETEEENSINTVKDDLISYEEVLSSENISVDSAYSKMKKDNLSNDEKAFLSMLEMLKSCEGHFVQKSEKSENTYTADVSFSLRKGKIYSSINYTGYMGTIRDGEVSKTSDKDYLFETHTIGDFYEKEQSFAIHFDKQLLHIQWADTCDYVLDRGNGFVDDSVDIDVSFEKTETYEAFVSEIDKIYKNINHKVVYSSKDKTIYLFFENMDRLKDTLKHGNSDIKESWNKIVENMCTLSQTAYNVIHIMGAGDFAEIYWVDELNFGNIYNPDEYSLWIENGEIKYNIAGSEQETKKSTLKPEKNYYNEENHVATQRAAITTGERNALEQAKNYLNFTAFSYSGLIEQLEYEGYSHSEAEFAANNCNANWNEQAAKKAAEYLDYMNFSKSELVDQLIYEGFTQQQAEYGVNIAY